MWIKTDLTQTTTLKPILWTYDSLIDLSVRSRIGFGQVVVRFKRVEVWVKEYSRIGRMLGLVRLTVLRWV